MKKNITQLTIHRLSPWILLMLLFIMLMIGLNFRSLVLVSMEDRVFSIAQITKAGLTAHMKAGLMDKRAYLLKEIEITPSITRFSIIRSDEVFKQFGEGQKSETRADPFLKSILDSKQPYFSISDWGEKATVRGVIPYIASSKGNLNCLECHHVSEGTALGAIDVELDVSDYHDQAFQYLMILFGVIAVFTIILTRQMSRIIEKYVRKPLLSLIHLAKSVFYRTDSVDKVTFQSEEFEEVASQFRKFGMELKERESRIEEKSQAFQSLSHEIDTTLKETLFAMGEAEERRSRETANHTRRVVEYSRLLGELNGLESEAVNVLMAAAPLHDIGKIGIPDSILLKPERLSDEERRIMQTHASIGYEILRHSERDVLQAAAMIAYQHHERWDGNGYPRGIRGEDIHIYGRIVAIVDVFDALGTRRVYKEPWKLEEIWQYFSGESGKAFDPKLVELFLANRERFEALYRAHYVDQPLAV